MAYEASIIDITLMGSIRRIYLVTDTRGNQWKSKGDRFMSDRQYCLNREWARRNKNTKSFTRRALRISERAPFWQAWKRKEIFERVAMILDARYFDGDEWWHKNFHRIEIPENDYPDVPSLSELLEGACNGH